MSIRIMSDKNSLKTSVRTNKCKYICKTTYYICTPANPSQT